MSSAVAASPSPSSSSSPLTSISTSTSSNTAEVLAAVAEVVSAAKVLSSKVQSTVKRKGEADRIRAAEVLGQLDLHQERLNQVHDSAGELYHQGARAALQAAAAAAEAELRTCRQEHLLPYMVAAEQWYYYDEAFLAMGSSSSGIGRGRVGNGSADSSSDGDGGGGGDAANSSSSSNDNSQGQKRCEKEGGEEGKGCWGTGEGHLS